MNFSHLYYTSSPVGFEQKQGYQIYNLAEDINQLETGQLVNFAGYQLPTALAYSMENGAENEEPPINFMSYELKTGRVALGQTVYLGKDYTDRTGNYFNDTAVFKKGSLPGYPMEYYLSPSFKTYLTEEEMHVANVTQPLLPEMQLLKGVAVTFEQVQQFIREDMNDEILKQLVESAIESMTTKKQLIIVDKSTRIPLWIAAIHYCFPREWSDLLPFATYTTDPKMLSAKICGMHDADTSVFSYQSDAYVFHMSRMINPQLTISTFTETVVALLIKDAQALTKLHKFMKLVGLDLINDQLNQAVGLYKLLYEEEGELSETFISNSFDVYLDITDISAKQLLTEQFATRWQEEAFQADFVTNVPVQQINRIAESFFNVSRTTMDHQVKQLSNKFFHLGFMQLLLQASTQQEMTESIAAYNKIFENNKMNRGFHELAYSLEHRKQLENLITENNELFWQAKYKLMVQHFEASKQELDPKEVQYSLCLMSDIGYDFKFDMRPILPLLVGDQDVFVHAIILFAKMHENEEALLPYIVTPLVEYIQQNPKFEPRWQQFLSVYPEMKAHLLTQHITSLVGSQTPISDVERMVAKNEQLLNLSFADQEQLYTEAAQVLIDMPKFALDELARLWANSDWSYIPPNTHIDLIQKGLVALQKGSSMTQHLPMLMKWKMDLIDDLVKQTVIERDRQPLLVLQQQLEQVLLIAEVEKRSLTMQLMEKLETAFAVAPGEQVDLVKQLAPIVYSKLAGSSKKMESYLRIFMPTAREEIFALMAQSEKTDTQLTFAMHYYEYLVKYNWTLNEQEIQYLVGDKQYKKALKAGYTAARKQMIFNILMEQVEGSNEKFMDKIKGFKLSGLMNKLKAKGPNDGGEQ